MKNNYNSQLQFISKHLFTMLVLALLVFGGGSVKAATVTVTSNSNWSTLGINPGDVVIVRGGVTLSVNVTNASCTSIQLGGTSGNGSGTLTFTVANANLTVSGLVQVGGWGNTNRNGTITFTNGSTLDAGSIILGGTGSTNASGTITMTAGGTLRTGSLAIGGGSGTWTPGSGTVNLDATNPLPATIFTTFNNLICSAGTTTMGATLAINGNLNISGGATFNTSSYGLTVSGTTTVGSGTLTVGAYSGTKIFTGLLTVNPGGMWNNSVSSPITFRGGITNNGTFNAGTSGTQTFDINSQSLIGNLDMSGAAVTVTGTGITLTNNGTLSLTANLQGTGTLSNATTGTINFSGNQTSSVGTLTNQGIINIAGSYVVNTAISTNTGTINVGGGTIASLTNSAGGIVNISTLSNNINTLTATATGNTLNYSGVGDQTVKNVTYSNLILSGSGTKTFTAPTTINNNFTINTGAIANLGVGLTHTSNAYYLDGVLQYQGSWGGAGSTANNINTNNFSASTGLLNATSGVTCDVSSNSISYSTGIISATVAENGNAVLTAPTGAVFTKVEFASYGSPTGTAPNFVQGACHATTSQSVCEAALLGNNTAAIAATNGIFGDPCAGTVKSLSVSATYAMPVCQGSNPGIITGSTPTGGTGTYTYVWGSSTTNATSGFATIAGATSKDYTPTAINQTTWYRRTVNSGCGNTSTVVQITVSQPNVGGTAVAAVGAINSGGTTTITATGYTGAIQWQQSTDGSTGWATVTGGSGATTATYTTPGLTTTTYYRAALTNNACPTAYSSTATVTVIQCSGTWTGATNTDWNIATNWCGNAIPTASTNVIIPNVTNKPIIGTAGGLCNNITIQSGSSLTQGDATVGASNLVVYGNWTNNGTYTSGVGTTTFAGASAQTIGGSTNTSFYNLTIQNTGGVTLSRPTTVTRAILLISGNVNTSSINSLTVTNPANSGIMGGSSGSYINGPAIWIIQANLGSGSSYNFPVGNNTYLPYTLVNPITGGTAPVVQVQAFSANSGGTVSSPLIAVSNTEYWKLTTTGNLNSTQISLGKGNNQIYPYNAILQGATVNGAYTSLNGTVGFYDITNSNVTSNINNFFTLGTNNTPTINILPTVLGGFGYIFNFGPSGEQSFSVNGTSLPASIVVSAPTDFEISQTTNIGFAQTMTLTRDAYNNVNNVKLYVRLKADLPVGTYNNESLSVTSNSTTKTIILNGTVYPTTPSIITSGGKSCTGDSIVLSSSSPNIDILYWTGPNNFYSQDANPKITPTTTSMLGTYTVTGSIPTGTNLIVNGDFEAGNTGFLSSYSYTTGANNNQGVYTVTDNANSLNGAFSPITPGNKQMVIDGATIANVTVWSQTVSVIPNSTYQFTYYLRREVDASPSIIQLYANNQALGTPFTASSAVGLYKKYYYNWFSGSSTSVTLDLRNQNTIANGNDFSLDNIDFKTVSQVSSSVTVTGDSKADVTIYTPTTNVASGTNVTFTATPTNGGTAPLYQWYVNNVAVGTNSLSSTFNYVPNNNDAIKVVMTSNRTCATTNNPATSTIITMKVAGTKNYWLGASGLGGTVWGDKANWTANSVPAPGDNVEFATTLNNGVAAKNDLYVSYNRIVGNIINNASGMNLIIPANTQLYVNNKITLTPVDPNAPYDQIQIKADPNLDPLTPIPNGSLIFHNSQNEKVYGSVEMYTKSYLNASPANEDDEFFWQYFGIPVESIKANPTFYGAYVRKANEAGDENDATYYWTELGNNDVLNAFDGYEICQKLDSKYLLFQGQLVNRDFSKTLIYSSGAKYPGQHLLANPYAAAINVNKINFGSDIDASVSLYKTGSYGQWSGNNGVVDGTGPGQFTTIPKSPAGNNGLPQEVPSMSSMLVRVSSTRTDANSVISFNYKDVINKNTTIQKVKAVDARTNTDLISTRIDLTGQHYSDRMWIFTEPSCTKNFDNGWDGRKMLGSSLAPQIYAIEPDGDYQVNSVSDMNNTDLAFQAGDEVEYTLKFTHENIQRQYAGVYLVDLIENKTVDVSETGSTYTFATAQSDAPAKRFKILTRPYEKGASDMEAQVKIFTAQGRVFVHNLSTSKGECTLYDIAGRAIKKASFAANAVTEVINNLTQGAYVVNTITNGEKVSKRVIVQ